MESDADDIYTFLENREVNTELMKNEKVNH
jgi:hypothetical protein